MLLAVDIGNSNIKFGIYNSEQLLSKFLIPTNGELAADYLTSLIRADVSISNAIVCSVVPEKTQHLKETLQKAFEITSIVVNNDVDFGLKINYRPLSALGTDRLVNSFAAVEKYGAPCIVCSMGTATTFDLINKNRELLGGVIVPGMKIMAKALHLSTAQLPEIEIEKQKKVLGNTTAESIQSGILYGHIAMVEGIVRRIKKERDDNPKIVATGGFASQIAENTTAIDIVDENLLLDGLRLLNERLSS